MSEWFKVNQLCNDLKRTNFMLFRSLGTPRSYDYQSQVCIDDHKTEQAVVSKFLGVLIDGRSKQTRKNVWTDKSKTLFTQENFS